MRLSGEGDSNEALAHLPEVVPVMLLGGVTLFPKMLLPLYIFEMRYRAMLERALETDRFLIMAQPRGQEDDEVYPVAGVGLIRACVRSGDGTSNLVLEGVGRVKLTGWQQLTPFRMAMAEPFGWKEPETTIERKIRLKQLHDYLRDKGGDFDEHFSGNISQIDDPDVLVDVIASILLADSSERQVVLGEGSNVKRQSVLMGFLSEGI